MFPDDRPHPMAWGSYPMAPWAGRIRGGRFTFDGVEHQLDINHHDGDGPERAHAIHGLVFDRPWSTTRHDVSDTSCTATRGTRLGRSAGIATQTIELHPDRVDVTLTVESTGRRVPGRDRLAPVVPQARSAGVRADRDVRT